MSERKPRRTFTKKDKTFVLILFSTLIIDPRVNSLLKVINSLYNRFELIDLIRRKKASLKSLKDTWLDLSEDKSIQPILNYSNGWCEPIRTRSLSVCVNEKGLSWLRKKGSLRVV